MPDAAMSMHRVCCCVLEEEPITPMEQCPGVGFTDPCNCIVGTYIITAAGQKVDYYDCRDDPDVRQLSITYELVAFECTADISIGQLCEWTGSLSDCTFELKITDHVLQTEQTITEASPAAFANGRLLCEDPEEAFACTPGGPTDPVYYIIEIEVGDSFNGFTLKYRIDNVDAVDNCPRGTAQICDWTTAPPTGCSCTDPMDCDSIFTDGTIAYA